MAPRRTLVALGLALSLGALASPAPEPVKAQVELLLDQDYFPRVLDLLQHAKQSIRIVMYYFGDPDQERPKAFLEALADAKARGVKISILLDKPDKGEEDRNKEAAAALKKHGIKPAWDPADVTTHTKALVVDGEYVVLGSANWTQGALKFNHETGALIRSPELARRVLEAFDAQEKKD